MTDTQQHNCKMEHSHKKHDIPAHSSTVHDHMAKDNTPFSPVTTPLSLGEGFGGEAGEPGELVEPSLYIFDFDGTLGDSKHLIVKTMQDTCRELNMDQPTEDAYAATIGLPLEQCFAVACHVDNATADRCATVYRDIFQRNNRPGAVPPFPGVLDTLRTLHEHGRHGDQERRADRRR